jgi:hypothetical protein
MKCLMKLSMWLPDEHVGSSALPPVWDTADDFSEFLLVLKRHNFLKCYQLIKVGLGYIRLLRWKINPIWFLYVNFKGNLHSDMFLFSSFNTALSKYPQIIHLQGRNCSFYLLIILVLF